MKHLIYYIYPYRFEMFEFNLWQLANYIHVFDGKKICYLAHDADCISLNKAKKLIRHYLPDIEITIVKNDKHLGEVKHFPAMLKEVIFLPGYTFYAHGKGVWRVLPDMEPIKKWVEKLYEYNLNYNPENLKNYGIAGAFRRIGQKKPLNVSWHFSGSFFWIKNQILRKKNWKAINQYRHGTEEYPAMKFKLSESYCIAHDNAGNLYKRATWDKMKIKI